MKYAIELIKALKSWAISRRTKIIFSSILAVATFIAMIISIYPPIGESITNHFDKEIDELKVIEANLQPTTEHFLNPSFRDFNEVAEVRIRLKNFSNNDILITSMEGALEGHPLLKFATASIGALGPEPEQNSPVLIGRGDETEIVFREGLKLEGITQFFDKSGFKDEFFSETTDFYMMHNLTWISRLNEQFLKF